MPRTTDARRKAIDKAYQLFQRQGYHGTGLLQVYRESGAPKGSFYFHFPGGKEELAEEAVNKASRHIESMFAAAAASTNDPVVFTKGVGRGLARWLEKSGFVEGCPVATIALEMAPHSQALTEACARAFAKWEDLLSGFYKRCGANPRQAKRLATLLIAALEGALLMCRAERSMRPFEDVSREVAAYVEMTLATGTTSG